MTVASNFVGIILHNVPQYKKGHAEIVLSNGGPILIYQISSTCTRVLVDVPSKVPSDLKEYMISTIAPQLPGMIITILFLFMKFKDHIRGPFLKSVKEQRLRMMPNSFLPPKAIHKPGIYVQCTIAHLVYGLYRCTYTWGCFQHASSFNWCWNERCLE